MILQRDDRIGGLPRYFLSKKYEILVRVPDHIKNCVAFVHYRRAMADPPKTAGTVFFVGMIDPGSQAGALYAVTAKHVIEACRRDSQDGKVLLRTHVRGSGGLDFVETDPNDWVFHENDESVDVAVLPLKTTADNSERIDVLKALDIKPYGPLPRGIASQDVIDNEGIGPGDEVFIVGLFRNHPGKLRNIPIVRIGNIAAVPEEKVKVKWNDQEIDAYLIEARSIGGLSGSPIFVHLGQVRAPGPGHLVSHPQRGGQHYLLGLVHGHFDLHLPDTDADAEDSVSRVQINSGIAIVVPVAKILEVLNHPTLVADRKRLHATVEQAMAGSPDCKIIGTFPVEQ